MLIKAIPIDVEHTLRNVSLLLIDLQQYYCWFICISLGKQNQIY